MALGLKKIKISSKPRGTDLYLQLPEVATASLPAAASANEGGLVYDTTLNALYFSDGTSWNAVSTTAGVGTLQQVTTAGATSNVVAVKFSGASSNANRLEIGDGTRMIAFYGDGTDLQAVVPSGDFVLTAADDIKLVPTGGDVSITGNLDVSGTTSIGTLTASTSFALGTDGVGVDANFYSTTAGDKVQWDASEKTMVYVDSKIHLYDSDDIHFGQGSAVGTGDFKMYSDGTHLYIAANADVASQALYLGDDTNDIDVIWEGDTNSAIFQMDSSANQIEMNGCDLRLQDEDLLHFGDGAASLGDFSMVCDGTDLFIKANANVADQAVKIGDATNEVDIIWYGTTSGDLVQFDSSDDSVLFTDVGLKIAETGAECALDVSSAATGADGTVIKGTGALTDGYAVLGVKGTGNLAAGGAVVNIDYGTGTPNTDARVLEIKGTGKDLIGIYADVDGATDSVFYFNSGGAIAAGKAVLAVNCDGTPLAMGCVFAASFTGTATNYPPVIMSYAPAKNVNNFYGVSEADGTNAWHLRLEDTKDDAIGVCIDTYQDSASPAAADAILRWNFEGEDAAGNRTEYARMDAQILLPTSGQEDGEIIFSVAADNGTLTQALVIGPQLNSANTGISVGSGAATAAITAEGAYSLLLQTNYGTDTAKITLESGANSDVILTQAGNGVLRTGSGGANATITSSGAYDLILNTNDGTDSGSITIADAANGDISITPNGTGEVKITRMSTKFTQRDVAAGTKTDAPAFGDGLIQYATDGADACAVTLPEAADNLGLMLTFQFDVDGGKDVVVGRTGADTIDENTDTGNTSFTMANAGEWITVMAVADNIWAIMARQGGTLA